MSIFFLAAYDSYSTTPEERSGLRNITDVVNSTGGVSFETGEFKDMVPAVLNAVQRQWILDLVPSKPLSPGLHSLSIKSSENGFQLFLPGHIPIP